MIFKGCDNIKLYKLKIWIKRNIVDLWYWILTPFAYYYSKEKEKVRYEKKKARITEQKAIKWIAEDIVRYLLINKNAELEILICDYANDDDFYGYDILDNLPSFIKRNKSRMAFWKFHKGKTEFQNNIVEQVKTYKEVKVIEQVGEFSEWRKIENYKKTVVIKLR